MDAVDADAVVFDAVIEPFTWGRNTYLVLRMPQDLTDAARRLGTRRVAGTVDAVRVDLGLNRAPDLPDAFAYVGPGLLRSLGVQAGAVVECVLAPADPDAVDVPDDVAFALEEADLLDRWEGVRAAERRRLVATVENAKRPETRARRIAALVVAVRSRRPPSR